MNRIGLLLSCALVVPGWGRTGTPLGFEKTADGALVARQRGFGLKAEAGQTTMLLRGGTAVVTTFAGANRAVRPEGAEPLGGKANYLIGRDAAQWRTGVALYGRAVYRGLYPGVDLVFYGHEGALEYDVVVRPGGRPDDVAFDLTGVDRVRRNADGSLALETAKGEVTWKKPEVYQTIGGARRTVAGAFRVHGRRVSFAIGAYDRTRELVIDPTLAYVSYLGGGENDAARGIAVDPLGNYYITGFTFSGNLPTSGSSVQSANHGGSAYSDLGGDAFVAKFSPSGALVYVTYLGGSNDEVGAAIAADASGNAYVTGYTASTNFPVTTGAYQTQYGGGTTVNQVAVVSGDAFVAKLNPAGSALIYSTYLGGNKDDLGAAIAVDAAGNAYVGGATTSTNFPVAGAAQGQFKGTGGNPNLCAGCNGPLFGSGDGFVAKLNAAGSALVWSTYTGGSLDDSVTAIALDAAGAVYAGGATLSPDFPTTSGAYQTKYGGTLSNNAQPVLHTGDGFVVKYDATGKVVYSTYLGGTGDDAVMGVAVDGAGAVYVGGFTSSADLAAAAVRHGSLKGPATITGYRGFVYGDAFAAKLAASGASLVYATYVGGTQDDAGMAIAVDAAGEAILGGFTNSTDFPVTADAQQKTYGGTRPNETDNTGDAFLAKLSADGATVQYASFFGGSYDDAITGVAIDATNNVLAVGSTTSHNLPVTANAVQKAFSGEDSVMQTEVLGDAFVAVFGGVVSSTPTPTITSVVNGASLDARLAPGTAADVFGNNLPASASAGANVGGEAATVVNASPTQWSIVIPAGLAAGASTVQVGTSAAYHITLAATAPALFSTTSDGKGSALAQGAGGTPITASNPAHPGDTVTVYATGLGATAANGLPAAPVTVSIGGAAAAVGTLASNGPGTFAVPVTLAGTVAAGNQPVVLSAGGVSSNTVTLPVAVPVTSLGPAITSVQNGASFQDGFPVNGWMTIKGTNLSPVPSDTWDNAIVNGVLPQTLDGVTVTVGGKPAYIYFVSPGQINAVAPDIAPGPAAVVVKNSLGTSATFSATAAAEQPGFFGWPGGYVVATHFPDYSYAIKNGTFAGLTTTPAHPGDTIILWGAGFGATTPAAPTGVQLPATQTYATANPVTVTIGGVNATVLGAAMTPGNAALFQVAVLVPDSLAGGDYPVVASVNGVNSATGTITVQK